MWNSNFAYAVGLITTDGSLSIDGRHINLTSKDIEQIRTFADILELKNKIETKKGSFNSDRNYYQIQFGNVKLYRFLLSIGLMPNKTKKLGALKVPSEYFADFLRGHLDGDGCTYSYWDKRWKNSFMLYTVFISASEEHLIWIQRKVKRLYGISGSVKYQGKSTFSLKFAKRESLIILDKMYYSKGIRYLERKYSKISLSLDIIRNHAGVMKSVDMQD